MNDDLIKKFPSFLRMLSNISFSSSRKWFSVDFHGNQKIFFIFRYVEVNILIYMFFEDMFNQHVLLKSTSFRQDFIQKLCTIRFKYISPMLITVSNLCMNFNYSK